MQLITVLIGLLMRLFANIPQFEMPVGSIIDIIVKLFPMLQTLIQDLIDLFKKHTPAPPAAGGTAPLMASASMSILQSIIQLLKDLVAVMEAYAGSHLPSP